ncbi:hypothetical protein IGI04_023601 [Brassica rapa subsp. trilocularis]|uniref:LTI65/LTI78 N-terminal domain-containing protein n=1 Tax=Brassica rapa subsp. trilocularis TaxID=1813537 RepID=A0ABQ7M4D7_BRACM|nr:hypothetical protein IGI04_023601 [Brassica rapa subsp. trilocularis]
MKSQGHRKKGIKSRANKVFTKVKEKAKKIKNSPIKLGHSHGHNHDHDVYEEEYGKQESEWHGEPDLLFTFEKYLRTPPKIVPPGTKDFRLVSLDYTKRPEPEPLRDTFYIYTLEMDVRTEAPCHPPKLHDMLVRE